MPTLRLRDGRALHYHALGRGRTVVLLHGFAMHGGMWIPSVLPLAGRYRFVLPDLRGFGRSHAVPYARTDVIANHVDDVEDLLSSLGDQPVLLGGLSMGALTGLALAARGGFRRVAGYVHIDQAARIHNDASYAHGLFGAAQGDRFAELRALLQAADAHRHQPYDALPPALRAQIADAFTGFVRAAVRPAWLKTMTGALRRERVAKLLFPVENWRAYLDCLRAYLDERYDFRDALAGTQVPVTVMVGESSEMYPAEGQMDLARSIPGARLVRFAGVGHAVPLEAPLAFVRALARALDEARVASRGDRQFRTGGAR